MSKAKEKIKVIDLEGKIQQALKEIEGKVFFTYIRSKGSKFVENKKTGELSTQKLNNPLACIALKIVDGKQQIGVSQPGGYDVTRFNKKLARKIALGRAENNPFKILPVKDPVGYSHSTARKVMMDYYGTIKDIEKAFRARKVAHQDTMRDVKIEQTCQTLVSKMKKLRKKEDDAFVWDKVINPYIEDGYPNKEKNEKERATGEN